MSQQAANPLDAIPDPPAIRSRLAQLMREQNLLRSLLRVSERKLKAEGGPNRRREEGARA
jgi:hypothetical protein